MELVRFCYFTNLNSNAGSVVHFSSHRALHAMAEQSQPVVRDTVLSSGQRLVYRDVLDALSELIRTAKPDGMCVSILPMHAFLALLTGAFLPLFSELYFGPMVASDTLRHPWHVPAWDEVQKHFRSAVAQGYE